MSQPTQMVRLLVEGWKRGVAGNTTLITEVSCHEDVAVDPPVYTPAACI